jgi:putative spermidine/putrescine transport system substrate-binding protein
VKRTKYMVTRRTILKSSAAAAALIAAPAIVRAESKTIVTTSYGGVYEDNYKKFVLDPFSKKTGAEFVMKYGGADEWLNNSVINRAAPEIDLPMLSVPVAARAIKIPDLFIDLNTTNVPNIKDIHPVFYETYEGRAVGFNYTDYSFIYNTAKVNPAPKSWADLWDPRFKGQVLCPGPTAGSMYEMIIIAARLNGGSEDNWRPAIDAMKRLKPNIVRWFTNSNEVAALIERGEATVAAGYPGFKGHALIDAGQPVKVVVPTEGAPMGVLSYHIPVNAKNRDLLLDFVNFATAVEQQSAFGNAMMSGMCNVKTVLDPKLVARIAPADKLLRLDWGKLQTQLAEMTQRMQREVFTG